MGTKIEFDAKAAKATEAMYLTPDVVGQRVAVLSALNLMPGERIIDVGVGPGLLAEDAAKMVGEHGHVTGVDVSEAMVTMARTRCAAFPQAEFSVADATRLNLPDNCFDAAVSTQVLEYVADVPAALKELHRVCKSGGRVVIMDTDWDSIVWHGSKPDLMRRVLTCWDDHLVDPHLPTTLAPKLRRAGFQVQSVSVVPLMSVGFQPHSYAAGIMKAILSFVRKAGAAHQLSEEEIQSWYDDQLRLAEQGGFFFSLNRYLFVARK
jgi:arsenite methyltransferase